MKVSQNFTAALLKTYLFFSVVSILINCLLPPFNKSMYYMWWRWLAVFCSHWLMLFCSALSLAYWCLWSLFLFSLSLSPPRGCRVDAATLSIKILWWPAGMRKVLLWTSCLGAQQKLWCYIETPISLYAHLLWVHPTMNMSKCCCNP